MQDKDSSANTICGQQSLGYSYGMQFQNNKEIGAHETRYRLGSIKILIGSNFIWRTGYIINHEY